MATHSSTLSWKIPWIKEHARPLQSMGLQSQTRLSDFTHSLTPHPGIEPSFLVSPALAGEFFTTSVPWEALGRGPCKISRRGKKKRSYNQVPLPTSQTSYKDWTQEVS